MKGILGEIYEVDGILEKQIGHVPNGRF